MTTDEHDNKPRADQAATIRRAVERVDVHKMPARLQRSANALLNAWAARYGGERPSRLDVCGGCQEECGEGCGCWCHGREGESR